MARFSRTPARVIASSRSNSRAPMVWAAIALTAAEIASAGICRYVHTCKLAPYAALAVAPSRLTSPTMMIPAIDTSSICAPIGRPLVTIKRNSAGCGIR